MAKIDTTTMKTMISAGILPLPWFIIWVTIGGMFMPGYSWISQHASEMTLAPGTANVLLKIGAFGTGVFLSCSPLASGIIRTEKFLGGQSAGLSLDFPWCRTAYGIWEIQSTGSTRLVFSISLRRLFHWLKIGSLLMIELFISQLSP